MKNFKRFMLLVVVGSLLTFSTSCSNDDGAAPIVLPPAAQGLMTAKIDGQDFESFSLSSSATLTNNGQSLILIATNSDGIGFSFNLLGYEGPGTYNLGGGINLATSASYSETDVTDPFNPSTELWQAPYSDDVAGTVTISEETDTKVVGGFEFTCKNTGGDNSIKTITNGAFDLGKQVQN